MKPLALAAVLCLAASLAALAQDETKKKEPLVDVVFDNYLFRPGLGAGASAIMVQATKGPNPLPARPKLADIASADSDALAREALMRVIQRAAKDSRPKLKLPNNGITGSEALAQLEAVAKGPHEVYGFRIDPRRDLPESYHESMRSAAEHLRAVAGPIEPGEKERRLALARAQVMRLRLIDERTHLLDLLQGRLTDGTGIDASDVRMRTEGEKLAARGEEAVRKLAAAPELAPAKTVERDIALFTMVNEIDLYLRRYASSKTPAKGSDWERFTSFKWLDSCFDAVTGGLRETAIENLAEKSAKTAAPTCVSRRAELLELLRQGKYDDAERILAEGGGK